MNRTISVISYRWIVFLLAAFYVLRMIFFGGYDGFGGPLRYLTNWALILSFFASAAMLAISLGKSDRRIDTFVSVTAVINVMVVILYWRIYFADPYAFQASGELGVWWQAYYWHGLGPALQIFDALFIHRSFRKPIKAIIGVVGVVATYLVWIETLVEPNNATPVGSVTSGLPYRFLNSLEWDGRLSFYITNSVVAVVLMLVFIGAAWIIRRLLGPGDL